MPALPRRVLQKIRDRLDAQDGSDVLDNGSLIEAIDRTLKTKRSVVASRARRVGKREARSDLIGMLRQAVWLRSGGECESCSRKLMQSEGELDHALGGSGRRRVNESVERCWRLCAKCHRRKTDNWPSRLWWLQSFHDHLQLYAGVEIEEVYNDTSYDLIRRPVEKIPHPNNYMHLAQEIKDQMEWEKIRATP